MHTRQGVALPASINRSADLPVESVLVLQGDTEMYPRESDLQTGKTLHSVHCMSQFARRDMRCHRCVELLAGAEPRRSSHRTYLLNKLGRAQRRLPLWGGF